jgi:hypothetical protein
MVLLNIGYSMTGTKNTETQKNRKENKHADKSKHKSCSKVSTSLRMLKYYVS